MSNTRFVGGHVLNFTKIALVASLICFGVPVLAQTYDCKITSTTWGGWVSERYIFVVDEAQNKATAYDGIIHHMHAKPIPVQVKEITDRAVRLRWGVKGIPADNKATGSSMGTLDLKYSAVINKQKRTLLVNGTVMNGGGGSSGEGRCSVK